MTILLIGWVSLAIEGCIQKPDPEPTPQRQPDEGSGSSGPDFGDIADQGWWSFR